MTTPVARQIGTWRDAEENAAVWMKHWGYNDARITSGGADGGIDVESRSALAQVKFEANQVGRPALQRLVGARALDHRRQLLFFSGTGYSDKAVEYAETMAIALFIYSLDGKVRPFNRLAEAIVHRPSSLRSASPSTKTSAGRGTTVGCGLLILLVGLFLLWGFVGGLFNGENFDDRSDLVPLLVIGPLLLIGGVAGIALGIGVMRKSHDA
ncbi:restriction endonuclease [Kribbella qitaiheensis]|uniref:restriction endonuclease n=1 Tax=Kribbella qitaiheensis TaxID=1544730 RepID=UPI003612F0CC